MRLREQYGALLILGFTYLLAIEVVINVGMNLGLVPVVGIGLPFISYGGSSLLAHALGLGLAESVITHRSGPGGLTPLEAR